MSRREGSRPLRHADFIDGPLMRVAATALLVSLLAVVGCRRDASDRASTAAAAPPAPAPSAPTAPRRPRGKDQDALPSATGLPHERRALQVVDGQDRIVDADVAREHGLTLVDLSDGWVPRIFADGSDRDGAVLPNHYRTVFLGLANNKTDGDGQPLSPGEQNYLELYGI